MWKISVDNLILTFRGGVLQDEEMLLQKIAVCVVVKMSSDVFVSEPILSNTVDYTTLVGICRNASERKRYDLLERLAIEIENDIRAHDHRIESVEIRIKKWPSLGLPHDGVEVTLITS